MSHYISFLKQIEIFRPSILLPALTAGTSNAIILISIQVSFAAMLFSGALTSFMSRGIGILLFGSAIICLVTVLKSSHPNTLASVQDAPVAILGIPLASIAATMMDSGASEASIFHTIAVTLALSTLSTGLLMMIMARFRLGDFVRFIPYPVIGGFLAGIGWILLRGGIEVMTQLPMDIASIPQLFSQAPLLKWIPGMAFALILYWLIRRYSHFMILPGMLLSGTLLFYAILKATGTPFARAQELGWLLGPFPQEALWSPIPFSALARVRWDLILGQALTMVSVFIISVISLLLNASGLEVVSRRDIDLNRELSAAGLANTLASFTGSTAGYISFSTSTLCLRLAPGRRIAGFITSGFIGAAFILGPSLLSGFPRPLAGAILVLVGLDMLWEWLYESWQRLPGADYALILVILLVIASIGFMEGVGTGLVIAVILFVVTYSRISIVKSAASGRHFQSHVERAAPLRWILDKKGDQIFILQLQGFIFFGTANQLRARIMEQVRRQKDVEIRYIVLDFAKVYGFDSSAMNSFERITQFAAAQGIALVFVSITPQLKIRFEKAGLTQEQISLFQDLDHGLEWCEEQIFEMEKNSASWQPDQIFESTYDDMHEALFQMELFESLLEEMAPYLTRKQIEAGQFLFRSGEEAQGICMVESGQISLFMDQTDKPPIRLRTMGVGSIVGEWGPKSCDRAKISVKGVVPGHFFHLTEEMRQAMEQKEPELAFRLYKQMAQTLSEQLERANNLIEDLI